MPMPQLSCWRKMSVYYLSRDTQLFAQITNPGLWFSHCRRRQRNFAIVILKGLPSLLPLTLAEASPARV
jgi:hypothetical protein